MAKIKFYAIKKLEWERNPNGSGSFANGINGCFFRIVESEGDYSLFLDGSIIVHSSSNKDSVTNLANEINTARVEAVLWQWVALPEMVLERAAGDTGTYEY